MNADSTPPDSASAASLPAGGAPEPLEFTHFPSRLHAFVFRNWGLVDPERLAVVLGATEENVVLLAGSMGLTVRPTDPEFIRRGYITLLRRNWHLLPYEQLMVIVEKSGEELAAALLEDDFLFIKFGSLKPSCPPLRWSEPTADQNLRAAQIRAVLDRHFPERSEEPGEPPFAFVDALSRPDPAPARRDVAASDRSSRGPRIIHSYLGLFGDPLMDGSLSSFPEGLLERLAARGVNGIWLHVILHTLAPGGNDFPELGNGHEVRLENLRRLVARAGRFGIGIYLYLNEPRALPHRFFERHGDCVGVREAQATSLCTSVPKVRNWLQAALTHVFGSVPGLAGALTITASENLTHCASHGGKERCPRCAERLYDEIIADVNSLIARGIHAANPDAVVLAWDWGWHDHGDAGGIIERLPDDVWLMSVSEWALPIERGGIRTSVGEYSLSAVGPGPRAARHWRLAHDRGLKTAAKLQLNVTWEISSIPYLPVLDLVAEHCERLVSSGLDGMVLSWSLGGYPSPNLEIAGRFSASPAPAKNDVLDAVARDRYGADGAAYARAAWSAFSRAFLNYPYSCSVVYSAPVQIGPANLLYEKPTGFKATMTGIPYDDLDGWRGPYPADVFERQFDLLARGWEEGIEHLERAVAAAPPSRHADAEAELRFAAAAGTIFRSVRNQVRFVRLRDGSASNAAAMTDVIDDEIDAAVTLYHLTKKDSRIGFESANQYFFVPGDLMEKVVNCEYLGRRLTADR